MHSVSENIPVKFRAGDTQFGVTRSTVKALAAELDLSEPQVIHMALSKFAGDVLPAYAPDALCMQRFFAQLRRHTVLQQRAHRWPPIHKKSPLFTQQALYILVGPAGVEPTTNGLKVRCSTS